MGLEQHLLINKNLRYEIKCMEAVIKQKEKDGDDAKFEKDLVKSYKAYLVSPERRIEGKKASVKVKGVL